MIQSLRQAVVQVLHTHDGARVGKTEMGKDLHLARYLERSKGVTVTLFWYLRSYVTKLNLVNSGYHQKFRSTRHLDLSVRARPYGFVGAIRH